jgi:predicted anti-sigma-YlaC factor YlaD
VRCFSCEPLLERYLEGALTARQTASIGAHLRTCKACAALLEELKVVDGLLINVTQPPLPENFTFAVLAHARTMPVPRSRRISAVALLTFYVAAAWIAALWVFAGGTVSRSALLSLFGSITVVAHPIGSTLEALTHSYGTIAPFAAPLAIGMLMVDAVALFGAFYFCRTLWPRFAAQRARAAETS